MRGAAVLALGAVIFISAAAQARVFSIGQESLAAYLRGVGGSARQGETPFAPSSGADTEFDGSYTLNTSYEFGMVYATKYLNWRFGFEILKPANLKSVKGSSAAGTEWYTVTNDISGYIPKAGLEANLKQWKESRLFASAHYGWATITVQNSYAFTTDGTAQFPGMADFREEIKGTAALIEYSMGFETLLSDTTTLALEAGMRTLSADSFAHTQAVRTFQGDVTADAPAMNTDGTARSLDLGGTFAALSLRFWIK